MWKFVFFGSSLQWGSVCGTNAFLCVLPQAGTIHRPPWGEVGWHGLVLLYGMLEHVGGFSDIYSRG